MEVLRRKMNAGVEYFLLNFINYFEIIKMGFWGFGDPKTPKPHKDNGSLYGCVFEEHDALLVFGDAVGKPNVLENEGDDGLIIKGK